MPFSLRIRLPDGTDSFSCCSQAASQPQVSSSQDSSAARRLTSACLCHPRPTPTRGTPRSPTFFNAHLPSCVHMPGTASVCPPSTSASVATFTGAHISHLAIQDLVRSVQFRIDFGFDQYLFRQLLKVSGTYFYSHLQQVIGYLDFPPGYVDPYGRTGGYYNTGRWHCAWRRAQRRFPSFAQHQRVRLLHLYKRPRSEFAVLHGNWRRPAAIAPHLAEYRYCRRDAAVWKPFRRQRWILRPAAIIFTRYMAYRRCRATRIGSLDLANSVFPPDIRLA